MNTNEYAVLIALLAALKSYWHLVSNEYEWSAGSHRCLNITQDIFNENGMQDVPTIRDVPGSNISLLRFNRLPGK